MDTLFDPEIMNTAFINDAYSNLKRARELLKIKKKRTPKRIGKTGNSKTMKSPTVRKLNGIFKTMTKRHSSPVKCAYSPEHNCDESLIDYSIWIHNLNEDVSKLETCQQFNPNLDETKKIEGLEDLMKRICAIAK